MVWPPEPKRKRGDETRTFYTDHHIFLLLLYCPFNALHRLIYLRFTTLIVPSKQVLGYSKNLRNTFIDSVVLSSLARNSSINTWSSPELGGAVPRQDAFQRDSRSPRGGRRRNFLESAQFLPLEMSQIGGVPPDREARRRDEGQMHKVSGITQTLTVYSSSI